MSTPQIGSEYRLDVRNNCYNEPISWINNRSKNLHTNLGEISGRIVLVKSMVRIMAVFYIVSLVEHPKDTFYTPKRMLMDLTKRLPIQCSCDLRALINGGCSCGAFQKEKNQRP